MNAIPVEVMPIMALKPHEHSIMRRAHRPSHSIVDLSVHRLGLDKSNGRASPFSSGD
jgi:hypothetical protein